MKEYIERTPWHDAGFASKPDERNAHPGEKLYRAYGVQFGQSGLWGNCFFVPAIGTEPLTYWSAELLEEELNAALWGNTFEYLAIFKVVQPESEPVRLQIGPIAHDSYAGWEKGSDGKLVNFVQRSFITPSGIFKQVKMIVPPNADLKKYATLEELHPIKGRHIAREASRRALGYRQ